MKIILDDKRVFPTKGGYNCVRTYEDCALLLITFKELSFISLDYDLSSEYTGYDVLVYMSENGIRPEHINVHSSHYLGKFKMVRYAKKHFPTTIITENRL